MRDLKGQKFGKLTVIDFAEIKNNYAYWNCVCDCGNKKIARGANLISGQTKSCGCLNSTNHTKHREGKSRLYVIWAGMKQRCSNPRRRDYKNYGGRGISVCQEWQDYLVFRAWALSSGYSDGLSIDRIDEDGNYCPNNCRWVNETVQRNNRTDSNKLTVNGDTKTATEWSAISGVSADRIRKRKRLGWSDEDAVFKPIDTKYQHSKK